LDREVEDRVARVLFFRLLEPLDPLSLMGTPARRASDKPIAIACLAFFAPCLPERIWRISRSTNSPAAVLADFPLLMSLRARCVVRLSGMNLLLWFGRTLAMQCACPLTSR
jgi:hypothetical protein